MDWKWNVRRILKLKIFWWHMPPVPPSLECLFFPCETFKISWYAPAAVSSLALTAYLDPEQSIQDHETNILYYKNTSLSSLPG